MNMLNSLLCTRAMTYLDKEKSVALNPHLTASPAIHAGPREAPWPSPALHILSE